MKHLLVTAFLFSFFTSPLLAQEAEITFNATEVASGIFMLEGQGAFTGGNLGILVGEDGVALIDDSMPPYLDTMLAAIEKVAGAPVDFVINTHLHGDHIGGNARLNQGGAHVVAHHKVRERLLKDGVRTAEGHKPAPKDALPEITFSESMTFHLNGQEAFVFHVDKAHTDGDAVIHFRQADVIHTGDAMFNGLFPFIDLDSGGSVAGYIAAQEKMLTLAGPKTKIIPGHGPLATEDDLQASVDMLKSARKRVQALLDEGKTAEEILAANPLESFHETWNWGFITTERMTQTLIRDLSGE